MITRLDVKPPFLVKGIHLEGLRKVGEPAEFADRYYRQGADEIAYHDIVASLYGRNTIDELLTRSAEGVFIPISVGGGLRSVEDALRVVRLGADRICLNTAAVRRPGLIQEIAAVLGSQAVILGVEAKRHEAGWEAMTDNGREHTGLDAIEWIREVTALGAGEIQLTSIDREGTRRGFDIDLIENARSATSLPLVAHGGAGNADDVLQAHLAGADAAAIASVLHYEDNSIAEIKDHLRANGVEVRT